MQLQFFKEVKSELGKVVWPSYEEFVGSTIVVLVLMTAFAIYLGIVDLALSHLAQYVFAKFGV
ncbi:preprotein translocase subunit SecE [Candidatus Dependentiae bacterium]|nr:preprotein translocase subunit SecE [Candidatus Dependentiae bacterium]MCC7414487.1 preprotein translocase subunit SecE [Campylobacterota bacterium]